jgi:hypothetical protein
MSDGQAATKAAPIRLPGYCASRVVQPGPVTA